ncbi:MAG: ATP-dependent zinc metalloprotease FtsH [Lachnospiraceae bacterium]|nr:ATP-dependent zinc metalloprotease FtsH [Lachnospiraceae bacterium]
MDNDMDKYNNYDNNPNNNKKPDNNQNNGDNDNKPKKGQTLIILLIVTIITIIVMTAISSTFEYATTKEISYNEFIEMVENDEVEKVRFEDEKIIITRYDQDEESYFGVSYWTGILPESIEDADLVSLLDKHNVEYSTKVSDKQSSIVTFLIEFVLPILIVWAIMGLSMRKISGGAGGIMGVGKSNAKVYNKEEKTGITFGDVAGQEEAKESLTEIVDFLHNPGKYASIGAKLPKGALLVGPPGTGKTLLAKAVAGEAGVPFFSLSGSNFVEMFVGVGASRVRDLFEKAEKSAPCIVFIDEIDAIGKSRDSRIGGNDEREQTLNQLLSEMDGFDSSKGIFLLGATNRPEVLDKALLRPGRFDRRIIVDRPDLKGRIDTLKVHSRNVVMDETVDFKEVALATSGAVGSDLANIVNEAAINAVKNNRKAISQKDLLDSVEVVFAGKEKKERLLNDTEKRTVAVHETGHALITAIQKNSEPVQKITIIPREMGSLGYVWQVPEEERYLYSKEEILDRIVTLFGGRAAEDVEFGVITTGASNDMEKATELARNMITKYGMSEEFGLMTLEVMEDQYLNQNSRMNCSDSTAAEVEVVLNKLLKDCYAKAKKMIQEHKKELEEISDFLYNKETITGKEFMEIYNRVNG